MISRLIVQTSPPGGLSRRLHRAARTSTATRSTSAEPGAGRQDLSARRCSPTRTARSSACCAADGTVSSIPPADRARGRRQVIVIAEDDSSSIRLTPATGAIDESAIVDAAPHRADAPERTLVLGWNQRAPRSSRELDDYVAPGSPRRRRRRRRRRRSTSRRARPANGLDRSTRGATRPTARRSTRLDIADVSTTSSCSLLRRPRRPARRRPDADHAAAPARHRRRSPASSSRSSARCSTTATASSPRSPSADDFIVVRQADQPDADPAVREPAADRGVRRAVRRRRLRDLPAPGRAVRRAGDAVDFATVVEAARRARRDRDRLPRRRHSDDPTSRTASSSTRPSPTASGRPRRPIIVLAED